MRFGIGEVLRKVHLAKTKKEKLEILRGFQNQQWAIFLRFVYDPGIKFLLPENVEYNKLAITSGEIDRFSFYNHIKRLRLFAEGGHPTLNQARREKLFRDMLETIDPLDAEAALAMKDKKLPYNIPRALIEEAYPGFLPPDPNPPKKSKEKITTDEQVEE